MAPIKNPRRAMLLVGVLVLAACEPAAMNGAPAQAEVWVENSVARDSAEAESASSQSALVESGLHQLVAMSLPAADDGTLGAGCSDEQLETLPDGDWYAFVLDSDRSYVTVDVACVYGPHTDQFKAYASADDAVETSALTNHVVINDVVHERTLRIAADAEAYLASTQWEPITATGFAKAAAHSDGNVDRGVWLRIEDGVIAAVVQPYVAGIAAG